MCGKCLVLKRGVNHMGEKAEYKSAKRSRKMIRTAFAKLMLEKEVDKITVTDIVKEADLNRGTFYAHYQTPSDVLVEIENEIMDNLLEFISEVSCVNFFQNPLPVMIKINHYLQEDIDYFKMLSQSSDLEQFLYRLKKLLVTYMENDENISKKIKDTRTFEVCIFFISGGIIELYKRWFHDELSGMTLEELAHYASKFITDYSARSLNEMEGIIH